MKDVAILRFAVLLIAALAMLSCLPSASAADLTSPLNESRTDQKWRLGNEQLELRFRRHGSQVVAHQLVNKLSGRTIPITQDDFSLGIEGRQAFHAADFVFQEAREEAIAGGRRLTLQLKNAEPGARLDVIYELGDRDFFVRRRLELSPTGPLPLREVDMWRVGLDGQCSFQERCVPVYLQLGPEWKYTAKHQGFGYPVFMEDTFWGLEYPAGLNHYENGLMTLQHYPGRTVTGRFVSKTAVLGVAEPGQVAVRFRQYLNSIIGVRSTPPMFFAWKTWVTVSAPNESNCLSLIDNFRRELFDPAGARLDSFALDDGWDKKASLWEIESGVFPRGFEPLQVALKPMQTGLGLWISPCSGYDHANWLTANRGYKKNAWDWLLCMSDPNYRRDMVKAVTELVKKYDVNYVKFDAYCAPCDAKGHDHHLPDNFAKEANTDAYLELQAALRRTQPGVFINITTGTWLSPWWLQHVDAVWDQVYDGWSPAIAPTPARSYSQITDRDGVFRKRCLENPWFPLEAVENLGIWTQNYRFIDEQIMTILGRGCRLISFYVPIPQGADAERDWRFFSSAINWARHNEKTLLHTRMILGDPIQLEPYGYAHFSGERGILLLRNPFVVPRTVKLKLDESAGWDRAEAQKNGRRPLVARIVYPYHQTLPSLLHYGDELTVELSAYEMLVVHVEPLENSGTALLGVRCQETERSGNRLSYTVHARPGENLVVPIAGVARPSQVFWNGQSVAPITTPQGLAVPLVMEGTPRQCAVEGGKLSAQTTDKGWKIAGNCVATVPEGTRATLHLMWAHPEALHPPAPKLSDTSPGFQLTDDAGEKAALRQQAERLRAVKPRCSATVNGKPVKVAAYDSKLYRPENVGDHRLYAEYPPGPWVWFSFDLPPGRSEVAVALECPKGDSQEMKAQTGWWLWAENPLQQGTLTLSYDGPLPATSPEPLPMAVRQKQQRQILTLQPVTALPFGGAATPAVDGRTIKKGTTT
jgi:hypothetical protein